MKIKQQIEKKEKELKELKNKLIQEQKSDWVYVPELKIEITNKQQFNGMIYSDILKEVNESQIATYKILQELRNIAFKTNWKKYLFMKDFLVFVPNPDNISKFNNYVAWLGADSYWAYLCCSWRPGYADPSLGVFLIRK